MDTHVKPTRLRSEVLPSRKRTNDRQHKTMMDAVRFGLITGRAMHNRHYFCSMNGVYQALLRMIRVEKLDRHEIGHSFTCYTLGRKGWPYLKLAAISQPAAGLPGPSKLDEAYAVLSYCTCGPRQLDRLCPHEIEQMIGPMPRSELRAPWYLDPTVDKLGRFVFVPTHWNLKKITRETKDLLESLLKEGSPRLKSIIENGHFLLVLLSITQQRAEAIKESLKAANWRLRSSWEPVEVRSHAIPKQ